MVIHLSYVGSNDNYIGKSRFLFGGIMSGVMEIDTDYTYTEDKKKVAVQYIDGLIKKGATLCTAENDYSGEFVTEALAIAYDDMIVRANMDGVKANAKSQAENALEELLREVAEEGYIIEFVWTD